MAATNRIEVLQICISCPRRVISDSKFSGVYFGGKHSGLGTGPRLVKSIWSRLGCPVVNFTGTGNVKSHIMDFSVESSLHSKNLGR